MGNRIEDLSSLNPQQRSPKMRIGDKFYDGLRKVRLLPQRAPTSVDETAPRSIAQSMSASAPKPIPMPKPVPAAAPDRMPAPLPESLPALTPDPMPAQLSAEAPDPMPAPAPTASPSPVTQPLPESLPEPGPAPSSTRLTLSSPEEWLNAEPSPKALASISSVPLSELSIRKPKPVYSARRVDGRRVSVGFSADDFSYTVPDKALVHAELLLEYLGQNRKEDEWVTDVQLKAYYRAWLITNNETLVHWNRLAAAVRYLTGEKNRKSRRTHRVNGKRHPIFLIEAWRDEGGSDTTSSA